MHKIHNCWGGSFSIINDVAEKTNWTRYILVVLNFKTCLLFFKMLWTKNEKLLGAPEYHKYVLPHLTWMVGPIMNLINGTDYSCERMEYTFMVLRKYIIIFHKELIIIRRRPILQSLRNKNKFINRNIYLIENLNNYIQSQSVKKSHFFYLFW